MNILFIHRNFPAQFRHVATHLASSTSNKVLYLSDEGRANLQIPNVTHLLMKPASSSSLQKTEISSEAELLVKQVESSARYAKALLQLQKKGFTPDIIYIHPGWGTTLFVRDIFPKAAYVAFFDWYYTKEADFAFFAKGRPQHPAKFAIGRLNNLCQLNALVECDAGITSTLWQQSQYPESLRNKITVMHEGIDVDFFVPDKNSKFSITGLDLSEVKELVTYTSRGLEPYRGFPQFYSAIPRILKERPECHIVIMAEDRVCYGTQPKDGVGFGERFRKEQPLDHNRVHFLDFQPYDVYLKLLQASSVHVYLTAPFVLSWSLLEAMSCGCLVVASSTEPVLEVIKDNENGLLTDFWSPEAIADRVVTALENTHQYDYIRHSARKTILDGYSLKSLLPQHIKFLEKTMR